MARFSTPRPTHGNLNTIQQTRVGQLSGGEAATTLVTTDNSTRTEGDLLMWADGNAVAAGISAAGGSGSAISVNAMATVKVNGSDASFDDIVLVNAVDGTVLVNGA